MGNSKTSNPFPHSLPLPLPLPFTNPTNKPPTRRCQSMSNLNDARAYDQSSNNQSVPPPPPSHSSSSKRRTNSAPSSVRSINHNNNSNNNNGSNKLGGAVSGRRSLMAHYCTNCNVQCRNPQVLSERFEIFCTGECYFSYSIREDSYTIDNDNNDDIIIDNKNIDLMVDNNQLKKDQTEKSILQTWNSKMKKENKNNSDNNNNDYQPKKSKPINIPLPYPDYVPY